MDFLFEYYRFRPSWLKKWSPGFNAALEYDNPDDLPKIKNLELLMSLPIGFIFFIQKNHIVTLDTQPT